MEDNRRRRRTVSSSLGNVGFDEEDGFSRSSRILTVDGTGNDAGYEDDYETTREVPPEVIQRTFVAGPKPSVTQKDIGQIEREIEQARQEKRQKRANPQAVSRLELLTGIGRLVTEVTIEKVEFRLRSLKSKELRYVMERAAKNAISNIGEAMMIRNYTLAFSLFEIDRNPISTVIGSDKVEDKVNVIDDFEEVVTTRLWEAYSRMIENGSKNVEKDLGSSPEEIVDNIKKL
jgi:hypothetical protein